MSIKHPKVVVLLLLEQLGHTKHCSIFKYTLLTKNDSGAVNRNTSDSPPVCSMFNEIAQYLEFFMFFPGVTIATSVS